jgi:hypothetical protein
VHEQAGRRHAPRQLAPPERDEREDAERGADALRRHDQPRGAARRAEPLGEGTEAGAGATPTQRLRGGVHGRRRAQGGEILEQHRQVALLCEHRRERRRGAHRDAPVRRVIGDGFDVEELREERRG